MSAEVKVKLISKRHVRQFALDMAKTRAHKFTRNSVNRLPSKGKTIT
jgi:hypothetical protein